MKNKRIFYLTAFLLLLLTEIIIALFVNDSFIRPYIGDVLVIILICTFLRIFFPEKPKLLPLFVTVFGIAVEILQYFDFAAYLGAESSRFISILLGRTFNIKDIICYAAGGILFFAVEFIARRKNNDS